MSILRAKLAKPVISFGLGRTVFTALIGQEVKIYSGLIYPKDYVLNLNHSPDLTSRKVNNNYFTIEGNTAGEYEITLFLSNGDKTVQLISNKITLIIT